MVKLFRVNTSHTSTSVFDESKFDNIGYDPITGKATNWMPNTNYKQYDIVFYQDRLLKCNTTHTSASTFEADKDNWQFLTSHINAWNDGYYYNLQDIVIYDGALYECIEAHKANNTFDETKWAMLGGSGGSGGSINYWEANIDYEVDDIVATNTGSVFRLWRCITNHTSSTVFDESKFQELTVDPIIKPWAAGTKYKAGQPVTIAGKLFIHRSTHQCNDINCSDLVPVSSYIFDYSTVRNYVVGDVVQLSGDFYICTTAHTPTSTFDETKWKKIGKEVDLTPYAKLASPVFTGNPQAPTQPVSDKTTKIASTAFVHNLVDKRTPAVWSSNVAYTEKQLVLYNKALYMCKSDHTSTTFLADKDRWEVICANIQFWGAETAFREGTVVVYNKKLYLCKRDHISSAQFSQDILEWTLIIGEEDEHFEIPIATESVIGGVVSSTLEGGVRVNQDGTMTCNISSSGSMGEKGPRGEKGDAVVVGSAEEVLDLSAYATSVSGIPTLYLKRGEAQYVIPAQNEYILDNTRYKMSVIYPETYQTMTILPDKIDTKDLTTAEDMFRECSDLYYIPNSDLSQITNFRRFADNCGTLIKVSAQFPIGAETYEAAFSGCESLAYFPKISSYTSCVNADRMFENCISLPTEYTHIFTNEELDNLSAQNMFRGSSVTKVYFAPDVSATNLAKFTSQYLKGDATLEIFTNTIELTDSNYQAKIQECASEFDKYHFLTSKLTTLYQAFYNKTITTQNGKLDLSYWDVCNVTNMAGAFHAMRGITELDISGWEPVSVTTVANLIDSSKIEKADLRCFAKATSALTNASYLCSSATNLKEVNISGWSTSKVTSMYYMFYNCPALKSIYGRIDMSACSNFGGMFDQPSAQLSGVEIHNPPNNFTCALSADQYKLFFHFRKDSEDASTLYMIYNYSYSGQRNKWSNSANETSVPGKIVVDNGRTHMNSAFRNMSKLIEVDEIDINNAASLSAMFQNCPALVKAPVMNTQNVFVTTDMFYGDTALTTVPEYDTSKCINMTNMFCSCSSLPATFPWAIDCKNIGDVTNLTNMFYGSSVTSVALKNVRQDIVNDITSAVLKGDETLNITIANTIDDTVPVILQDTSDNCNQIRTIYPKYTTKTGVDALDTSALTKATNLFRDWNNLQMLPAMDLHNVETAESFAQGTQSLKNANLNLPKCTLLCAMFANHLDLETANIIAPKCTDYQDAFVGRDTNAKLRTVTITGNIQKPPSSNFTRMFQRCKNLESVTITGYRPTNCYYMFDATTRTTTLTKGNIPVLDTSLCTDFNGMFYHQYGLEGEFPWKIDCSSVTTTSAFSNMFNDTQITAVTLKNLRADLRNSITSNSLGKSGITITFTDDTEEEAA